jgi:hypothetical protein
MLDFSDADAIPYTETRARTVDRYDSQQALLIVDFVDSARSLWIDGHQNRGNEEATGAISYIFGSQ